MLERNRPVSHPFRGFIDVDNARPIRKVKLPRRFNRIDFSVDYSSQLYPSSQWVTENRNRYDGQQTEVAKSKPNFVITSLDTRKHKPQTTQIFHIKRIHKKPVCSVQASFEEGRFSEEVRDPKSVYKTSYQSATEDRGWDDSHLVRHTKEAAEGIVPINDKTTNFDVRTEMMLPICDSTVIPSTHNPHRYLLRKRKVPPPFISSGVVYQALERPRMTSYEPGMPPTGDLPFQNEAAGITTQRQNERISVTTLSGGEFSRRKCIHHPPSNIRTGFDGGVASTTSHRFDDRNLPYIRARTII